MNSILSILAGVIFMLATSMEVPYTNLEKAMESNDAKAIVNLGKDKILLNILGKEGAYNHSQAEMVLSEFFDKKPKGSFTLVFRGKENTDGVFAIGNYVYSKETYRCTFHFRTEKGATEMESLTIEKQ